jgi:retinol dehydrogenase 12
MPFGSSHIPSLDQLNPDLVSGKTVLVTGAGGGLGLEAVKHYVRLGAARIILAVRRQAQGEETKQSILSSLDDKKTPPVLDVWTVDLSSFASVVAFCDRIDSELDHLDIALLNAAVSKNKYTPTVDGWDETLQVNALSTVLMGTRLLPKLRESTKKTPGWTSRLSFVVARAHGRVAEDAPWLNAPNVLEAMNKNDVLNGLGERYIASKLILVWSVLQIAQQTTTTGSPEVLVTYCCPGPCVSDLARDWKGNMATRFLLFGIQKTIAKTAEEGGRIIVLSTLLDTKSHGKFLKDKDVAE